ncbi:hypothetical protein [Bordetella genomosp. 5]|uniref:Uncharacterized protein n=1 Tax=Bordetella genomosp. 5 TaxID=1395608 RepID=A0A261T4R4_9BORD|nr:hypothetical protein [Bordetella genomosp. 5]OZI44212.1 hypothetical protein CAL25_23035 [Bordetella genomosp. 5]
MMRKACKILLGVVWTVWLVAALALAVGVVIFERASQTYVVPIKIASGATAQAEVYRWKEAPLWLDARFGDRPGARPGEPRPELGEYSVPVDTPKGAYPRFANPGEPLRVRVRRDDGAEVLLAATPTSASSARHYYRDLYPAVVIDGTVTRDQEPAFMLAEGTNNLTFTIEAAGAALSGETIDLVVNSPIALKRTARGYENLSTLLFWPILAQLLGVVLLVLLGLTWWYRRRARRAA